MKKNFTISGELIKSAVLTFFLFWEKSYKK